jgi:hypothetical protein
MDEHVPPRQLDGGEAVDREVAERWAEAADGEASAISAVKTTKSLFIATPSSRAARTAGRNAG